VFESTSTFHLLAFLMALVLLVVLTHGWMARRQVSLRSQLAERKGEYERLGAEVGALAEEVAQCRHGIGANSLSVRNLQGELGGLQMSIRAFLEEHPELAAEYDSLTKETGEASPEQQE